MLMHRTQELQERGASRMIRTLNLDLDIGDLTTYRIIWNAISPLGPTLPYPSTGRADLLDTTHTRLYTQFLKA